MQIKVKNEAEKAIAEKLQTNLATYEELTEEERSFLHKWEVFCHYLTDDGKWKQTLGITGGGWRYHLEPKLDIVIEPETFAEKEGIILCPIERQNKTGWYIIYPGNCGFESEVLGGLYCKGYEHLGWVHNGKLDRWSDINCNPLVYISEGGAFWSNMASNRTPSTATHSVWRKVEK